MKPVFIDVKDIQGHKITINIFQIARFYEDGDNIVVELSSGATIDIRTRLEIFKRQINGE